jgi:hypothetical protein
LRINGALQIDQAGHQLRLLRGAVISANNISDSIQFVCREHDSAEGTRPATVPVPAPEIVTGVRVLVASRRIEATSLAVSGKDNICSHFRAGARNSRQKGNPGFRLVRFSSASELCRGRACPSLQSWFLGLSMRPLIPLAQVFDSIAQLGRLLEFELLGVFAHFEFETGNCCFNLIGAVALDVFQLQRYFEVVSFGRSHQRRLDRLDDRLGVMPCSRL